MSNLEDKICEECASDNVVGEVHEYLVNGEIITHYSCIMHLSKTVSKYSHTFKNNKW